MRPGFAMFRDEPNGEENGGSEAETVGEKNDGVKVAEGKFNHRTSKTPDGDGD